MRYDILVFSLVKTLAKLLDFYAQYIKIFLTELNRDSCNELCQSLSSCDAGFG
jgi:hypothetical protein